MARIERISTRPFSLAMKGELRWGASSRLTELRHVLVSVTTDEGHTGVAEAPARPTIYGETVASIETIIAEHLAPQLMGLDLSDTQTIAKAFSSIANNHAAKGALDIALHEARAKTAGKTLFEAQRGPQEKIRVSFILGIADLNEMVAEARRVFGAGVSVFKLKIGRNPKHDEAIIKALWHEFAGEDVILYADANETLSPETAAKTLDRLANLTIAYIEEPLPVHLLKARAQLKAKNILPIIADDSCFSVRDLERELAFDTFDILNIKTARTGFTESKEQLRLAQDASKGVMLGSQASSGLGTLHTAIFASKTGVTHPSELSFPLKLKEDSLENRLVYKNGFLATKLLAKAQLKL